LTREVGENNFQRKEEGGNNLKTSLQSFFEQKEGRNEKIVGNLSGNEG